MSKSLKIALASALLVLLSACSQILHQPMDVELKASNRLNPDNNQRSLPVLVKVYQLSNDIQFKRASYKQLWHDDISALGDSLMRQTEFMVKPGSKMNLKFTHNKEAKFIGVVAMFREPSKGQWRAVYSIEGRGIFQSKPLQIVLNEHSVNIQ